MTALVLLPSSWPQPTRQKSTPFFGQPRSLLYSPSHSAIRARRATQHCQPTATSVASLASTQAPPSASTGSADCAGPMRQVSGLSEVAGRYKALLLDQFGVLHDGRRPYPGAVEAVATAAAAGLRLLIISNSSRRAAGTLDKLAAMGFNKSCFEGVVTSGELTHRYLTRRPDDWWAGLGSRCLHINWSRRGPTSLQDFGLQVVTDPRDADFFLAHGTEALSLPGGGVEERPLEDLQALLRDAAEVAARVGERPPPLVVANPDVVTVDGDELVAMPGSLAAAYSAAGGPVVLMGKPAPLIYSTCGEVLGLPPGAILAVGDSLEHDVAGAVAAGLDSLFIAGGIHTKELLPTWTATSTVREEQRGEPHPNGRSRAVSEDGEAAQEAEELGLVDMAALRQLVCKHLRSRPGSKSESNTVFGSDGSDGRIEGAPTYVTARFVW